MIKALKKALYFTIAGYFRAFSRIYLVRWNPKVIVVTGSQGKTTLFSMLEAQFGSNARYAHRANSSFGIPFDILGLHRKTFGIIEWPIFALLAPFRAFRKVYKDNIYIVEADCDRSFEGEFLASLLRPTVTAITGVSRTHSEKFFVPEGQTIETVTAKEFAMFARYTKDIVFINKDAGEIAKETESINAKRVFICINEILSSYKVTETGTHFEINNHSYDLPFLLPRDVARSVMITKEICAYFDIEFDDKFTKLILPPGRNSLFKGIKNSIIIDSTYNTSLESLRAMLELFKHYPKGPKWIVLGDMLELGRYEQEEHERIANMLIDFEPDRIILVGPRLQKNTLPILKNSAISGENIVSFLQPVDALSYINTNAKGGEVFLFKGARFLEGVVEKLLANKSDAKFLARREDIWVKRRKQWGL